MDQVWCVAALWLSLVLIAVLIANWLKVSTALSEIVVGTVTQLAIGALVGGEALGAFGYSGHAGIYLLRSPTRDFCPGICYPREEREWKDSSFGEPVGDLDS